MFLRKLLIFCLLFVMPLKADVEEDHDEGFPHWTLVQTSKGNKQFQHILKSDQLTTFADNKISTARAIEPATSDDIRTLYRVYIGHDEALMCGGATRFFVANKNEWVKAVDLRNGDFLISNKDNKPQLVACRGCEETDYGDVLLKIKIDSLTRCYFVGKNAVLVHNYIPVISITFSWAFGEGAAAGAGAGAAGAPFFGPLTISVGATIGGVIGGLLWTSSLGEVDRGDLFLQEAENLNFNSGDFRDNFQSTTNTGGPEDPKDPRNQRSQSTQGQPPKHNFETIAMTILEKGCEVKKDKLENMR